MRMQGRKPQDVSRNSPKLQYKPVEVDLAAMANPADRARFDAEWQKFFSGYERRLSDFFAYSVPDEDEREELVQELFIRAYRAIAVSGNGLRSPNAAWSWLLTIGKNLLRDAHAKKNSLASALERYGREAALEEELIHEAANVLGCLAAEDDADPSAWPVDEITFATRVSQLTDHERQLLHLRFVEELEWADVAKRVGKSYDAVRKQFSRLGEFLRDG
jgi:RNA polymerase sigma factor (sigma-70 family)